MKTLTPSRLADYSRLDATIFRHGNVLDLKTVVVGAGALGNEVVKALGLLGAGRIAIVDPDTVESSNLTRSVFFRSAGAEGRNKAVVMAEAARSLFPDSAFTALPLEIADVGFGILTGTDLLFSCVDSDLARLEIAYASTQLGIAVADSALGAPNYSRGRVTWFPADQGACFGCKLTPRRLGELLTLSNATVRPCFEAIDSGVYPSTPTMAAIIGSLQVELGLRHYFEETTESVTMELSLDTGPRMSEFKTRRSLACPFHDEVRPERRPLPGPDSTVGELLGPGTHLALDWPICAGVRCLDCGHGWSPMRRAAAVRRHPVCPHCGSRSILEQELIRTIEHGSRWSGQTAAALGLPENHWHTVRVSRG